MSKILPPELLTSLHNVDGFDEKTFSRVHESGEQITSIRFNSAKNTAPDTYHSLLQKVPWSNHGYYLSQRPSFTADPLFHAGTYYVQEASSMFLEEAINQSCDLTRQVRVLDLCAAPGGKSTLIQSVISTNSLLVSNEIIKTRVNILSENLTKWGAANVIVTNNDPGDFQRIPEFYDLIVVDAPCSGSGLFRKDPGTIDEWSLKNVAHCSERQQRILTDILPALKPGGILIYSTCSYSASENEEISDWLISSNQHPVSSNQYPASGIRYPLSSLRLSLKKEWNIVETVSNEQHAFGYRFYPDKLKGEGFYLAAFKKDGMETDQNRTRPKNKLPLLTKAETAIIKPYFKSVDSLTFYKWNDEMIAFPSSLLEDLLFLQSSLYIKKAGIKAGTIIRDELIPDHEFALSNLVADSVPSIIVEKEAALQYLRRQDLHIETDLKGWVLVKFQQASLGWVKILTNRINNYYPKNWRILNK